MNTHVSKRKTIVMLHVVVKALVQFVENVDMERVGGCSNVESPTA